MKKLLALSVAAAVLVPASSALAAPTFTPKNATWTQTYITEPDGTKLHADVLRPKGLTDADKTPVIVSIGPYFNHSGQEGAVDDYEPVDKGTGPSNRFQDFVEGGQLMERGYTFVMVDLRGFGGSTGCLDWGGPGEQADVVETIKWAATQPWSTGAVGTYGKSYDGMTGLIAAAKQPEGLKAVVSGEPVYDDYRYLYSDGIRRLNWAATPALYDAISITPGPVGDDPLYNVNGASENAQRPGCHGLNWTDQAGNEDHYSPYWRARNIITMVKGSTVPVFLTQGTTENNTVADGLSQFLANHQGPERGWIGPWLHVRGNEKTGNRLAMGRTGWFDEVMRYYDKYLKGVEPTVQDPNFAVQTNDGVWRGEAQWPPADAVNYTSDLNPGTYTDTTNSTAWGNNANAQSGVWTISPQLPYAAHLAGSGSAVVDVTSMFPRANLTLDVYDIGPDGSGQLVTRQAHMIFQNGRIPLDLWSTDWKFPAGHRVAVRVTDLNADWNALAMPTNQTVTVEGGTVTLPFLKYQRTSADTIQGQPGVQLASYMAQKVTLPTGF
jgi:predicted acyl esterase